MSAMIGAITEWLISCHAFNLDIIDVGGKGQSIDFGNFQQVLQLQGWGVVNFRYETVSAESEKKQDRVECVKGGIGQNVLL
uniref:Uncharacterized protein n=1 Tax=Romanomermis culicivorax TaxID=13658 RepID=A0A915K854_ROMCU